MDYQNHAVSALPQERPSTYSTEGWMGLGANMDGTEILFHTGIQLLDCPAHSDSLYWLCFPQYIKILWQYNVKRTTDTAVQQCFSDTQYRYGVLTFQQNKEMCWQHG